MAHNIITGKEVPGDWSCGIEPAPVKEPRSLAKVRALTAIGIGAVVGAAWTFFRGRGRHAGGPPTMILSPSSGGSYRVNSQAAGHFKGRS